MIIYLFERDHYSYKWNYFVSVNPLVEEDYIIDNIVNKMHRYELNNYGVKIIVPGTQKLEGNKNYERNHEKCLTNCDLW